MESLSICFLDTQRRRGVESGMTVLIDERGQRRLRGSWPEALAHACIYGMVQYFAETKMYGIQACWQEKATTTHCWMLTENLFAEPAEADTPILKPNSWAWNQRFQTPYGINNYLVAVFSSHMAWPPQEAVQDGWTDDQLLHRLFEWFKATNAYNGLKDKIDVFAADHNGPLSPPERKAVTLILADESTLQLEPKLGARVPNEGRNYQRLERDDASGEWVQRTYHLSSSVGHA